jgi:hypothetical protein
VEELAVVVQLGAVYGTSPQGQHHIDELVSAAIAGHPVRVARQAEVGRGRRAVGRHRVPGDPAAADVVEGEQPVGQLRRVVVRRRQGADDTQVVRRLGKGRQDQRGLQRAPAATPRIALQCRAISQE